MHIKKCDVIKMNYEIFKTKQKTNNNVQKKYVVISSTKNVELFNKMQKLQSLTNATNDVLISIIENEIDNAIDYFEDVHK